MAGKHRIHVPYGVYQVLLKGIPGYWAMQGFWKRCLIKVCLPGELSLQHAITKKDLTGSSRSRRLSEARGVTGWLAAEKTSATLTEVAGLLNRDPANISRAAKKIRQEMPEVIKLIDLLKDK